MNAIDPSATALMDPFCGSGTTLVEGRRLGLSVVGIDQNPLAAWISSTKLRILEQAGNDGLSARFDRFASNILQAMTVAQRSEKAVTPRHVEDRDDAYLRHWFPEPVLAALWGGLRLCREANDEVAEVVRLCISNIVRQISWQLPEDLRVRRRPTSWVTPCVADVLEPMFERARQALAEIERATALDETQRSSVVIGSSRDADLVAGAWPEGRRLVVTSPPYATALPYIDTDRLSIVLLGLAPASEIRELEQQLTGSREWRKAEETFWTDAWQSNAAGLPEEILDVLARISLSNAATNAGFRRRAVPPLLYRYFAHMGETLNALANAMQPGEHVVMVVGNNRTGSGSHQVEIPTPGLLGRLSTMRGFAYRERIELETWARYGMHSRNSVNAEDAVVMTVAG